MLNERAEKGNASRVVGVLKRHSNSTLVSRLCCFLWCLISFRLWGIKRKA